MCGKCRGEAGAITSEEKARYAAWLKKEIRELENGREWPILQGITVQTELERLRRELAWAEQ